MHAIYSTMSYYYPKNVLISAYSDHCIFGLMDCTHSWSAVIAGLPVNLGEGIGMQVPCSLRITGYPQMQANDWCIEKDYIINNNHFLKS